MKQTAQPADKITTFLPVDDAWRRPPTETGHPQFSPAIGPSGTRVPQHGQRGVARIRACATTCRPNCLRPLAADHLRRAQATSAQLSLPSVSAAIRPTAGFRVQDLTLPGGFVDEKSFNGRRHCWKRSTTTSPRRKRPTVLEAMDTFYQRAYAWISSQRHARGPSTSTPSAGPPREYRRRDAAGQRPVSRRPAGWWFRGPWLRVADLRRLGHARHIKGSMTGQLPASTRPSPPWSATSTAPASSIRR